MNILESLNAIIGKDNRGLIRDWRKQSWLPPDQFEVAVLRLVEDGTVKLIPAQVRFRAEEVVREGIVYQGKLCLQVEKVK